MDLLRLDPHYPLRLQRHRWTDFFRSHSRQLSTIDMSFPILLLPIPSGGLCQRLLVTCRVIPLPTCESEHLTYAHEDGDAARFEDFTDGRALAALGCSASHFVENGFEDGETGANDTKESFEGGEHGDESVCFLRVGGNDGGGVVDAVESQSTNPGEPYRSAKSQDV